MFLFTWRYLQNTFMYGTFKNTASGERSISRNETRKEKKAERDICWKRKASRSYCKTTSKRRRKKAGEAHNRNLERTPAETRTVNTHTSCTRRKKLQHKPTAKDHWPIRSNPLSAGLLTTAFEPIKSPKPMQKPRGGRE